MPETRPPQARQRWRLILERAADRRPPRERETELAAALDASRLPLLRPGGPATPAKVVAGAPLPLGIAGSREPVELFLLEPWTIDRVRAALVAVLPPGERLLALHDVWVGVPALPGLVVGADYRVALCAPLPADLPELLATLRTAERLVPVVPREGGRIRDLRPLLVDATLDPEGPRSPALEARFRHDPALGAGRPEELLALLGERLGTPLVPEAIVRTRLLLADDPDLPAGLGHPRG